MIPPMLWCPWLIWWLWWCPPAPRVRVHHAGNVIHVEFRR